MHTNIGMEKKMSTNVLSVADFRISKIINKWWHEWSDEKQREFYWRLTNPSKYDNREDWNDHMYYENSYLRCTLTWDRRFKSFETFIAYVEGKAVGWVVVEWKRKFQQGMLHAFVKKEYRRSGIGSVLFNRAVSKYPKSRFRMYHWNKQSRAFFLGNKRRNRDNDLIAVREWTEQDATKVPGLLFP